MHDLADRKMAECSPRAWGWSGTARRRPGEPEVFPTRVGMVRHKDENWSLPDGVPHARGDGPSITLPTSSRQRCSPRAWGWSAVPNRRGVLEGVFPTRVGMVRTPLGRAPFPGRVPHARGDGPLGHHNSVFNRLCSPRAWGWSESDHPSRQHDHVFPTRVGMVRGRDSPWPQPSSVPHARGDGPALATGW